MSEDEVQVFADLHVEAGNPERMLSELLDLARSPARPFLSQSIETLPNLPPGSSFMRYAQVASAQAIKELAKKAINKQLQPQDWEGNTFTISNLGMFGIEEFTAIINPPDACIMAIGGIKQTPIVKDEQMVIGNVMKVTLSCDHRVVDGAVGSSFLQTLKQLLEDPVRILV